jgi:acetylornithine deacetylase/succinyl-diaminopimelate desuccinylase-like protein
VFGYPDGALGPGGEGAHEVEEWVSIDQIEIVARTLLESAERFCA